MKSLSAKSVVELNDGLQACLEKRGFHAKPRSRERVPMRHELLSRKERRQGARLRFVQAPFHGFRVAWRDMRYCYEKFRWASLPLSPPFYGACQAQFSLHCAKMF